MLKKMSEVPILVPVIKRSAVFRTEIITDTRQSFAFVNALFRWRVSCLLPTSILDIYAACLCWKQLLLLLQRDIVWEVFLVSVCSVEPWRAHICPGGCTLSCSLPELEIQLANHHYFCEMYLLEKYAAKYVECRVSMQKWNHLSD
jgi:hypothetical protein